MEYTHLARFISNLLEDAGFELAKGDLSYGWFLVDKNNCRVWLRVNPGEGFMGKGAEFDLRSVTPNQLITTITKFQDYYLECNPIPEESYYDEVIRKWIESEKNCRLYNYESCMRDAGPFGKYIASVDPYKTEDDSYKAASLANIVVYKNETKENNTTDNRK